MPGVAGVGIVGWQQECTSRGNDQAMAAPYDHSKQNAQQVAGYSQQFTRDGVSGPTAGPPGYFPPPKPRRSPFRVAMFSVLGLVVGGSLSVVATVALSGAAAPTAAQVDANGNVTRSGGLDVGALTTGQCFDEPAAQSQVSGVEAVPCGQPHDAQVIGSSMLGDDSYNEATIQSEASNGCQKLSDGPDVDQSKLGSDASVIDFVPTAESWANLDREVTCAVDDGTGTKLTGSVMK